MSAAPNATTVENNRRSRILRAAVRLFLGQCLALLMSCTGLASTLLVNAGASFPLLQAMCSYVAIAAVFVPLYLLLASRGSKSNNNSTLAPGLIPFWISAKQRLLRSRKEDQGLLPLLFACARQLLPYAAIALVDLEANYLVVMAYRYTDMTSVQLLDCFTVPCVMVLSLLVLGASISLRQGTGAAVAVGGLICLVVFDVDGLSRTTERPNALLGDMLCLLSSLCYAISNVACETVLKKQDVLDRITGNNADHHASSSGGGGVSGIPDETTPLSSSSNTHRDSGFSAVTSPVVVVVGENDKPGEEDGTTNNGATINNGSPPMKTQGTFPKAPTNYQHDGTNGSTTAAQPGPSSSSSSSPLPPPPPPMMTILRDNYTNIVTYLALMSSFGVLFSIIQFCATGEAKAFWAYAHRDGHWTTKQTGDLLFFCLCMLTVYAVMPALFMISSATFANLSLLTADIYSIIWNVTVFGVRPKPLFFIPFVVILGGVAFYDTNGAACMKKDEDDEEERGDGGGGGGQ